MMKNYTLSSALIAALVMVTYTTAQAKSLSSASRDEDNSVNAVIPSPNQEFGNEEADIVRRTEPQDSYSPESSQEAASNEALVPVYVSPFVRSERSLVAPALSFDPQESSHAPANYAPRPSLAASTRDLKTSASYGHHHHGHHGGHYDHSGWLDMGAWTGGKGSFGWYADYPVGGKHGYGRK